MEEIKKNTERSLLLSAVRSYEYSCLEPFLTSLDKVGYKGRICFFVDDVSDDTIKKLKDRGVEVIPFKSLQLPVPFRKQKVYLYRLIPGIINFFRTRALKKEDPNRIENDSKYAAKYLPIMQSRFALYYDYLVKNKDDFDKVIISDVRDVVFQKHPLKFDMPKSICCFLESKNKLIKDCEFNSKWIQIGFGKEALDKVGDKLISCAGVTLGYTEAILEYLKVMSFYLTVPEACGQDGRAGVDQGVHNYIIHEKIIKNYTLYDNDAGPVLTLGYMTEEEMQKNDEGLILNKNGEVINVLHQFDRHPNLTKEILQRLKLDPEILYPRVSKWSFSNIF
jgi:hypothetical protein